jgi:hypothetical protein
VLKSILKSFFFVWKMQLSYKSLIYIVCMWIVEVPKAILLYKPFPDVEMQTSIFKSNIWIRKIVIIVL